jgi:putative endopeptidase
MHGLRPCMISFFFTCILQIFETNYPCDISYKTKGDKMKKSLLFSSFAVLLALIVSCSTDHKSQKTQGPNPLVSHIDASVKPGDDFFMYANGKWFKENPIPPTESNNGLWQLIGDTIKAQIRNVCETSAALAGAKKGSNKQKIGDFFFSGMDSTALNKRGISDLKSDLDMIDGVRDLKGLVKAASYVHAVAGSPLFGFWVAQDDKISSKYAVYLWQGGLSLPDRSFYFDTDARAVTVRREFVEYLGDMFQMMGFGKTKAGKEAGSLMKLETALAKSSRKLQDTRDPLKNYHKMTFKRLSETTPDLDWAVFMKGTGLHDVDTVIVGQPEFLTALNGYLKSFPLGDWKKYLKFHLVRSLSGYLDDKTFLETFGFYGTVLNGMKEPKPRWKRVVEQTDGLLGDLIGQVYVAEYLPKGTKKKLLEIGNAIKRVYAERVKALDWMSAATKKKALKKLDAVIMKVGYPDKWKDMSSLRIDRSSYARNVMNANQWEFNYRISKYGKPVDRTEWDMEPQTYNAYYNPSNNEIVIPGCWIMVPGYERKMADDALLYSNMGGSTFGHEITHGFDDQGSKYDEYGNLHNWWTPEDSAKFRAKTRMIVEQFNGYVAVDTLHINGEMTQGENIADLAGVMMGYEAFKKTGQYRHHVNIAGLTPDQRYFLGYALAWMVNVRPEAVASLVRSDVHSPVKFRVNGPLSDMPEFYAAFGVKEGDAMWRPDSLRVKIW